MRIARFAKGGEVAYGVVGEAQADGAGAARPGAGVLTRMVMDQANSGRDGSRFLEGMPLGRFAEPAEISRLVAYLASDESSYSTGSEFVADGGLLSGPGY